MYLTQPSINETVVVITSDNERCDITVVGDNETYRIVLNRDGIKVSNYGQHNPEEIYSFKD